MTIKRREYKCAACGQPIEPLSGSYNLVDGKPRHTTCPTSTALASLPSLKESIAEAFPRAADVGPSHIGPRYYTLPEAADLVRAGQSTLRRYIRNGKLPAKRLAGGSSKVLIEQSDLLALLEDAREAA